jgi:hypothetical protein
VAKKKKSTSGEKSTAEKRARVRWPFPRATLEEALKIPYAIKDLNGGNPWEPDEVRKAIGAGTGGNAYFYLTMWVVFLLLLLSLPLSVLAQNLGELSANPFNPDSTSNPLGAGSPFKPDGLNNPFSPYGSPYSNQSATNPFATDAPRLYDQQGQYRGKLSANPYDPDSTSNPYGRYGSLFSPDSIKNPYGAGSPYSPSSPTNPYGRGLRIEGR